MYCHSSFLDKSKCMSVLGEHQIAYLAKDIFERINHDVNSINMPERIMGGGRGDGSHDAYSKFADKGVPPGLFYVKTKLVEMHGPVVTVTDDTEVMDDKRFDELFAKVMHGPSGKLGKRGTKKNRSKGN